MPLAPVPPLREHSGLLLESKLHGPAVRPEWVPRQQLVQDLTGAMAKLVLVEAPAGFGKTTAVAQWRRAASQNRPFAWVFLDRGDDDPARLWWHVVTALQRTCPGLGGDLLRFLATRDPDIDGELLPRLVNALAGLAEPVTLVLDDYHLISEPRCHKQIEFLLVNLVFPAQIAITTRAEPPLPLARLRASGDLAEFRMSHLRFTLDQAAALIDRVAGVRLTDCELADLIERTEGWPAGAYLAALAMRGRDPATVISRFSGSNRHVADYLFEEVLTGQSAEVQRFLTCTSILDRFTASLCEAVTAIGNAAETVDLLVRENLFVVPLDDARQWFRYHHLFRQFLRSQLDRREPEIVAVLHARASAWHAAHGLAEEAIDQALAGDDTAVAIELIATHWIGFVSVGRMQTVRGWIAALGDQQVSANPLAAHVAAWVAALSGEPQTLRRLLPVMETGQHSGRLPDGMQSLAFSAALLRGTFGFDGMAVMCQSAARAVELEDDQASPWYPLALTALGFSRYLSGEPGAEEPLRRAMTHDVTDPLVQLTALVGATLAAAEDDRNDLAKAHASAARRLADDAGLSDTPQGSLAHIAVGIAGALDGRLAEARSEFERALESRRGWLGLSPWPTFETMIRLASVLLDLGDATAAAAVLAEAGVILDALPDGAQVQLGRLESLRRRLSQSARQTRPLTDQERVVLRLLRGTLSVREIGRELDVSRNTVKSHIRAIYQKLGVSTRADAVARASGLGL